MNSPTLLALRHPCTGLRVEKGEGRKRGEEEEEEEEEEGLPFK